MPSDQSGFSVGGLNRKGSGIMSKSNVVRINVNRKDAGVERTQHSSRQPAETFELTVFTKSEGPLTKHISLSEDGKLINDSSCCFMARGNAHRQQLSNMGELADLISGMESNQALALGSLHTDIPNKVRIVTQRQKASDKAWDEKAITRTKDNIIWREGQLAVALIDFDGKDMPKAMRQHLNERGFRAALKSVLPELNNTACLARKSTSAGLYRKDTKETFQHSNGEHLYVLVTDGADVERFLKTLHQRCWLNGFGWYAISTAGSLLERSIIDSAVGGSERLVFEGPPTLDTLLAQNQNIRKPVIKDGKPLNTQEACPDLTALELAEFQELISQAKLKIAGKASKVRDVYVGNRAEELVKRTGKTVEQARRIIQQQCEGILLPDVVLPFDNPQHEGKTVGDVLKNPELFVGVTLADPNEGIAYGRGKAKIMRRAEGMPLIHSFAHGGIKYVLKSEDTPTDTPTNTNRKLEAKPLSEFENKKLSWLLYPFLPRKVLTCVSGEGDVGKTTALFDILARITSKRPLPQFDDHPPKTVKQGSVLICCKEEDESTVIKPRMSLAGADMDRVLMLGYKPPDDPKDFEPIDRLDTTIKQVEQIIIEKSKEPTKEVRAMLIEPITEFAGGKDIYRDDQVRDYLNPLKRLATKYNLAIIYVLHLNKKTDLAAKHRGLGAMAFRNVARSRILVADNHEQPGEKYFALDKANYVKPEDKNKAAVFTLTDVGGYARVSWQRNLSVVDSDELLSDVAKKEGKEQKAKDFLKNILSEGSCYASYVTGAAAESGISESTLRRARVDLQVVCEKEKGKKYGKIQWKLPD
jgi:hypothetical protein